MTPIIAHCPIRVKDKRHCRALFGHNQDVALYMYTYSSGRVTLFSVFLTPCLTTPKNMKRGFLTNNKGKHAIHGIQLSPFLVLAALDPVVID